MLVLFLTRLHPDYSFSTVSYPGSETFLRKLNCDSAAELFSGLQLKENSVAPELKFAVYRKVSVRVCGAPRSGIKWNKFSERDIGEQGLFNVRSLGVLQKLVRPNRDVSVIKFRPKLGAFTKLAPEQGLCYKTSSF